MGRRLWAKSQRGLIVALVAGMVGFLAGGGTPGLGQAGAADSPPAPEFHNTDPNTTYPWSDVVRVGPMLYLAGVLGLGDDGKLVPGGITPESERTMENLKNILESNGSSVDRVVSCLLFLADIRDREAFNVAYQKYFAQGHFPARTAIGTSGLYAGARVEISCQAVSR